jgi:replicative DNA helicase
MSSNPTAEMALLGALLTDASTLKGMPWLRGNHFSLPVHGDIFDAINKTTARGPLDLVLVLEQLGEAQEQLRCVGGPQYLVQLVESCPSSQTAPFYAQVVYEHAARRHLAVVCQQLMYEAKSDLDAAMVKAVKDIEAVQAALNKVKGSI